jgi:CRP-like cAMP-binding protein
VGLKTIRLFGERLEEYEDRLSDLIRKEVPARLAGLLLQLSEQDTRSLHPPATCEHGGLEP